MKYIVKQASLKDAIKKRLDIDLTGKISLITGVHEMPQRFIQDYEHIEKLRTMMNRYGPFYLIKVEKDMFLAQPRSKNEWYILEDFIYKPVTEDLVVKKLGII